MLALALAASCWALSADSASAQDRWIYDCGDPFGDTTCYLDVPNGGYIYGRSEGQPARGPNPLGPPYTGSTDVDTFYDMTGIYHQYLVTTFGRNGPNGLGGTGNGTGIPSHVYRVFANADGSSVGADLCDGTPGLPAALATTTTCVFCTGHAGLDVFGHEMNHIMFGNELGFGAVTNEFGTLNEAMADFFGEAFERFATGSNDWIMGTGFPIPARNLADPPSQPQGPYASPDRYLHPDFYTGSADGGGVHINAGVINKASYLAVEGGTFNGYTIAGIGFDKMEQIWYRALTTYFTTGENFNGAAIKLIQATDDLYGQFEVRQVTRALQAVEIYPPNPVPEPTSFALAAIASLIFVRRLRSAH